MTSPSTPRSTRTASAAGDSPNILTPGQKIKAMMAQFDSDFESDTQATNSYQDVSRLDFRHNKTSMGRASSRQTNDSADDSDDADEVVRPKGRMAARMQGDANNVNSLEEQQVSAFFRLSKALRSEREKTQKPQHQSASPQADSSDDDLPPAGFKRRQNASAKQTTTTANEDETALHSAQDANSTSPLFVSSPAAPQTNFNNDDENAHDNSEEQPKSNARFLALVAQKRKEREERERIEADKKAARRSQMEQFSSEIQSGEGEESEADDGGYGQKLSQKTRQPRKASKKAMEEMSRETQRMSRNMQLAHQAQTKKKITKESLFARFNFMQPSAPAEISAANSSSNAGSQNSSDGESPLKKNGTPHTSPILGPSDTDKSAGLDVPKEGLAAIDEKAKDTSLPTLGEAMASAHDVQEQAKQPSVPAVLNADLKPAFNPAGHKKEPRRPRQPPVRVLISRHEVARGQQDDSDSDDLEVVTSPGKSRRVAAFENLPTRKLQESVSMTKLKALAHITSPNRKTTSMNPAELSASLLYKARQQAAKERRERIEELRAKGVVIETAEERAAMEDDMEDLVEKARQEADEIARQERAAKKNGHDLDDEEDDEDYALSGSDDASSEEDDEEEDDTNSINDNPGFVDQEAEEDDESADDQPEGALSDTDADVGVSGTRRKRRARVVSDDEEEDNQPPSTPVRQQSHVLQSAEPPPFLGMGTTGDQPIGLTQAFAGTLADDDTGSQPGSTSIPFSLPDPGQPIPRLRAEDSEILVRDSQEQHHDEPELSTSYSQNVTRVSESPAAHNFSQFSQLPDPTQDEGFVFSPFDPAKRFRGTPPVSTVDTVLLSQNQSPIAERKGRQLRRGRAAHLSAVEEEDGEGDFEINPSAFNIMKKAAKKPAVAYDKKNSKAKGIVDEAAEESEDEYAGLGGASDDSEGEEDAYDHQMINDNSGEVVDEKQLAALNADHQRNRDQKDVAKLLKDITTGALRRRRGPDDDFDLDDSDDEHLARRREKQREFAKMRRALLADDKIGQLADNPKKAAFFKAIEDREIEDDFELEFLEEEHGSQNESSQDVHAREKNDSTNDGKKRKRPLEPSAEDATNRPPPHLRRTAASVMSKKPATLAEIRETLSFLTETPEYDSFHEDASLDEEDAAAEENETTSANDDAYSDDAGSQSKDRFAVPGHPRRTRGNIVDRIALLRQASSNSASATSGSSANNKMAFHNGGGSDGPIASGPKNGGAVNSYTAAREKERERQLRMKERNGGSSIAKLLNKHAGGGLGALAGKGQWD
ncbi:hypothetical protein N7462_001835 [Penicillium macrosclerotiorum]|uniref:uncharacterized protein n=1 Tax=Penicillium macrosclerotiorum TaxID=303699 RepID=UPI002549A202|nr:uncharacterized protein N7462_001835 [Penicillium macrosclerotiorum]KAJ5692412.1 hypothetical protein N7462_001835 [Penicillium macrosclerotiorum]